MKHLDLFMKMYHHYRHIYISAGNRKHPHEELYSLKQRHLLFIFHELGLLSQDLTSTALVDIITEEDRDEDGYFNLGWSFFFCVSPSFLRIFWHQH